MPKGWRKSLGGGASRTPSIAALSALERPRPRPRMAFRRGGGPPHGGAKRGRTCGRSKRGVGGARRRSEARSSMGERVVWLREEIYFFSSSLGLPTALSEAFLSFLRDRALLGTRLQRPLFATSGYVRLRAKGRFTPTALCALSHAHARVEGYCKGGGEAARRCLRVFGRASWALRCMGALGQGERAAVLR